MKIARTVLWMFLYAITLKAQWSDPVILSTSYKSYDPYVAIDQITGDVHVVYIQYDDRYNETQVYRGAMYVKTDKEGNILIPPEPITGAGQDQNYWHYGPAIAVDSDGFPHVCYRIPLPDQNYEVYYTRRTHTGWLKTPLRVSSPKFRGYMARMTIDPKDRVHICIGSGLDDVWGPVRYVRVENSRITQQIEDILGGAQLYRTDARIELNAPTNDQVYVLVGCPGLHGNYEGPITYLKSDNSGDSFSIIADIHSPECYFRNSAPDLTVDNNGNAHMIYGAARDLATGDAPSIRYARYSGFTRLQQSIVTGTNELKPWYEWGTDINLDYGVGSIATTRDGAYIMVAYVHRVSYWYPPKSANASYYPGILYYRTSEDGGATWSARQKLSDYVTNRDARNAHYVRSKDNNFYVVYPYVKDTWDDKRFEIRMQYLANVGDEAPTAQAGGPYSGSEGQAITLDGSQSTDNGQNQNIVKYEWDIGSNGSYEYSMIQPTVNIPFPDNILTSVTLRVTDVSGQTGKQSVNLTIHNLPPVADAGADLTIKEGESAVLNCTVTDPGTLDTHTLNWDFGDSQPGAGKSVNHEYSNDGVYQIIVRVQDKDGATDSDTVKVTVQNVPPTANAGGPYQASINVPIQFTGSASDPGVNDRTSLLYEWDLDDDGSFETPGQTVQRDYSLNGAYLVRLKVSDDHASHIDTAIVNVSNATPVLSGIPKQIIQEGQSFAPLNLDDYVSDPDQPDNQLDWTIQGNVLLHSVLTNHTLQMTSPGPDWFGSETMTLIVTDPGGLTDTATVDFIVQPVNDPPRWTQNIPDIRMDEDTPHSMFLDSLRLQSEDVDDPDAQLIYAVLPNPNLTTVWNEQQTQIIIQGILDWNGTTSLIFSVTDTAGLSDLDTVSVIVNAVPDAPADFLLLTPMLFDSTDGIWPNSIAFSWNSTYDPDNAAGSVYFIWTLQNMERTVIRNQTVFDTTLSFIPDSGLQDGRYLWWATAYTQSGISIRSRNTGFVIVGKITSVESEPVEMPETWQLCQNYPNPFNPETKITFHLPESGHVSLSVLNSLGQEINRLVDENKMPGIYSVIWNASDAFGRKVPSGIYLMKMQAGGHVFLKKMILLQ